VGDISGCELFYRITVLNLRQLIQAYTLRKLDSPMDTPKDRYQAAYYPDSYRYYFGYNSLPRVAISGAPADADDSRWTMMHDGDAFRLYMFKRNSPDRLYQFVWNGASYAWGYDDAIPTLRLTNIPADAEVGTFAMLYGECGYHLYLRRKNNPTVLYQLVWDYETFSYKFGCPGVLSELHIQGFPSDTDWSRWSMLHDGKYYRIYAFRDGSNFEIYQGAWDGERYTFGHASEPILILHGAPPDADFSSMAMLFENNNYRLYVKSK
jgi:hypothetical protein